MTIKDVRVKIAEVLQDGEWHSMKSLITCVLSVCPPEYLLRTANTPAKRRDGAQPTETAGARAILHDALRLLPVERRGLRRDYEYRWNEDVTPKRRTRNVGKPKVRVSAARSFYLLSVAPTQAIVLEGPYASELARRAATNVLLAANPAHLNYDLDIIRGRAQVTKIVRKSLADATSADLENSD